MDDHHDDGRNWNHDHYLYDDPHGLVVMVVSQCNRRH